MNMLWKSCSKFNFLQVFHSMFCQKIDILAVAKEKLCIATIFIRLIDHLEIVIDIKYQYYQTIFRNKKAFLRFGCLCSNATVHLKEDKWGNQKVTLIHDSKTCASLNAIKMFTGKRTDSPTD